MAFVKVPGAPNGFLGVGALTTHGAPAFTNILMDAANEAIIVIGHVETTDEGSHTIDTTGSSSIGWRAGSVTFANAGTTLKVGLAAVLGTTGPPGQAVHVSDVITLDVSRSMTGGGGGVAANAWQTHVPTAGSKTIAHGDLVAFVVQMTARGGADSVQASSITAASSILRPTITSFVGGTYANVSALPNVIITFSDGAIGYFQGADIAASVSTRTWNSGSAAAEYGQLYSFPFPLKVYGIYGWADPDADFDAVLYSDPLGTPVPEKTVSIDANTVSTASMRRFHVLFPSPYTTTANQNIGVVFKPGGSNVSAAYRTISNAGHRVADVGGTDSYGISRASGAFANANSSLDHYYIGLIAGAFKHGVSPTYALGI